LFLFFGWSDLRHCRQYLYLRFIQRHYLAADWCGLRHSRDLGPR
jgi:hypothetical protein